MQAVVIFLSLSLFSSLITFAYAENSELTEETLARRINSFGCSFLGGVFKKTSADDNILVSPVSAYTALALLHVGAVDDTLEKLSDIMKVSEFKKPADIHERLRVILTKISSASTPSEERGYETSLANGIFMRRDFPIKDSYTQSVKSNFGGIVEFVDFRNQSREATDVINNWISRSTKGRIANFYEKPLSFSTIAVLASALYFNAKWKLPFPVEDTKTEIFNAGSAKIQVPMMNLQCDMFYVTDDTLHYESVTLPYSGRDYEFTVYLQHTHHGNQGSLSHLYHVLNERNFAAKAAQRSLVHLKLPKMKFAWKKSVVEALGLESLFALAHMANMTSLGDVTISDMMHATDLEVDEKGTIATAASGLEVVLTSGGKQCSQGEPIMFHVDRPFLMTITHRPTQTNLFAGIIRNPIE